MPKTLQAYQQEFDDIKKTVTSSVPEMESLEHNLDKHREIMVEGFKALGVRIHEVRQAGGGGARIEDFMADKEVALMVKELANRRETAKAEALKAETLFKTKISPVENRLSALHDGLAAEIAARSAKSSSATLGLNQSVKAMQPLLDQVIKYQKSGDQDLTTVISHRGANPPGQFDRLYASLMTEELNRSRAEALNAQEQLLMKQQLNDKVMQRNTSLAKAAALEVTRQGQLAQTAHKAKNVPALANAKKASATALQKIHALLDPYDKAMKDAKLVKALKLSPDADAVLKGIAALRQIQAHADGEDQVTQSRRMV